MWIWIRYRMLNIQTRIRIYRNLSKRIQSQIRSENIRTIFIPGGMYSLIYVHLCTRCRYGIWKNETKHKSCALELLPPSRKEYNYGIHVGQVSLNLTKFIANSINIYVSN